MWDTSCFGFAQPSSRNKPSRIASDNKRELGGPYTGLPKKETAMKLYKLITYTTYTQPKPGSIWYAVGLVTTKGYQRVTVWEVKRTTAIEHLRQLLAGATDRRQ